MCELTYILIQSVMDILSIYGYEDYLCHLHIFERKKPVSKEQVAQHTSIAAEFAEEEGVPWDQMTKAQVTFV